MGLSAYRWYHFSSGEISPKLLGRYDIPAYATGAKELTNVLLNSYGVVSKRPGTVYVDEIKDSGVAKIFPWDISPVEGLVVEAGSGYFRYYTQSEGAVYSTGTTHYETSTPYTGSDVGDIRYAQIDPYGFIVHPNYIPYKIARSSNTSWSMTSSSWTISSGDSAGEVADFLSTDEYPSYIDIYDNRLILAKSKNKPRFLWGSVPGPGNYDNFTNQDDEVTDPLTKVFQAAKKNEILWIIAERAVLAGTTDGVWRLSGQEEFLTASTDIQPKKQTSVGSADVQPFMWGPYVVFVGKGGKKLYAVEYIQAKDKYQEMDLTANAGHIAGDGFVQIVAQENPGLYMYARRADGKVAVLSMDRDTKVMGWTILEFDGEVESMAVTPTDTEDRIYLLVNRTVDGSTKRYIEYFSPMVQDNQQTFNYLDSSVFWDGGDAVDVTSISAADPAVCAATGHGFENGDKVRFSGVEGNTEVNGEVYTVDNKTDDDFELYTEDGSSQVDFSGSDAGSGGTVEKVTKSVASLDHLEGKTVQALIDGGASSETTVDSGEAAINAYGNKITIGLPYTAKIETTPLAEGPSQKKRLVQVWLNLYETYGLQAGVLEDGLSDITFHTGDFTMGSPPELLTGDIRTVLAGNWDEQTSLHLKHDIPLPLTVLAVVTKVQG